MCSNTLQKQGVRETGRNLSVPGLGIGIIVLKVQACGTYPRRKHSLYSWRKGLPDTSRISNSIITPGKGTLQFVVTYDCIIFIFSSNEMECLMSFSSAKSILYLWWKVTDLWLYWPLIDEILCILRWRVFWSIFFATLSICHMVQTLVWQLMQSTSFAMNLFGKNVVEQPDNLLLITQRLVVSERQGHTA